MMTDEERQSVKDTVEAEGFDYTFIYYSHFPDIKDKRFQKLRKAYVAAADALSEYVGIEEEGEEELLDEDEE